MLKNYLKIALRTIRRHKGYSLINIVGLALGMACTILILLWVQDELSYDNFHQKKDTIYRIIPDYDSGFTRTCDGLAPALKASYPEVVDAVRFKFWGSYGKPNSVISYQGENYDGFEKFADPAIFAVFTFLFVEGNPKNALSAPNSVVLTEKMAKKVFKNTEAIGNTIKCGESDCIVTGVVRDIPRNSHLQFDWIRPFDVILHEENAGWENW